MVVSSTSFGPRLVVRRLSRVCGWRPELAPEVYGLGLLVLVFVGVTVWWLSADTRVQDWDNGLHTILAFTVHDEIAAGQWTAPFTDFNTYPPLVHIVGALGVFVGGRSATTVILTSNIVFVPLLVVSAFGVGRLVYGRLAGFLAAVFALGVPMFVSMMHVFWIDGPQAAMVAASVWAILASRRFERVGIAALAGVAVGLSMLTKETSAIFLAGPVAVVILRGGWRRWRGLILFAVLAGAIALPWYIYHRSQLNGLVSGQGDPNQWGSPPIWSAAGLAWYLWDALDVQYLLPMMLFLAVGVLSALRDTVRRWRPENLQPELLVGGFVSWLGITIIGHKDARFTIPALIYVAVLSTGWIARIARPALRRVALGGIVAIALMNFLAVSVGLGGPVRIALPGAPAGSAFQRVATLYSPLGYVRGGPQHDGDVLALMRGLNRAGVQTITFDAGSVNVDYFTTYGLQVLAIEAGLTPTEVYAPASLGPHDAFMLRHAPEPGDPPPCQLLTDGTGIYVELGDAFKPFQEYSFICPGRHPEIYKRTAPLPISVTHVITGEPRRVVVRMFRALHRHGITTVEFNPASAQAAEYFDLVGLTTLAQQAGLQVPATYDPAALGPKGAFLLLIGPTPGLPPACGSFPDGEGLYAVLGNPAIPTSDYRYYCPWRSQKPVAPTPTSG
jgi:4-amino-4-deoxy-L-arabinose transferase-like glycosyltransferase